MLGLPSEVVLPEFAGSRRRFVSGLLDWRGPSVPDARVLDGVALRTCGMAHIRSIVLTSAGRGIASRLEACPLSCRICLMEAGEAYGSSSMGDQTTQHRR